MDNQWLVMALLVLVMLASLDIIRRSVGQVIQTRHIARLHAVMRRLRRPAQPWVTVIIYGKKDEAGYAATVRSLRRSRYYAYDVVTVGPRARTYQTAYRNSQRGKLVLCVPSGCVVDRHLIKRAVALREERREWQVAIEPQLVRAIGLVAMIRELGNMIWGRHIVVDACVAAALRHKEVPMMNGFSVQKAVPAIVQILAVIVSVAVVWVEGLDALWYVWLLLSVYVLALIWLHYETVPAERWKMTFLVPSALFLLPVSSIIVASLQLFARK